MAAAAPRCPRCGKLSSSSPGGPSSPRRRARVFPMFARLSWNITKNPSSKHRRRRAVKAPRPLEALYEVFISEMEEAKSTEFQAFFGSEAAVTAVTVPGQTNKDLHLKLSNPARLSCAAMIDWLLLLAESGYTLSGCFSASDFALTRLGYFKGKGLLLQSVQKVKRLRKRGKKGMDTAADMARAADLIETEICSGVQILPADLQDLLDKLRHFKKKDMFIMKHHCSLYSEFGKEMLFSTMFTQFKILEKLNRAKWQRIISKISSCQYLQCNSNIRMDTYLASVFAKKKTPNRKVKIAFRLHFKKYKGRDEKVLEYGRKAYFSDSPSVDIISSESSDTDTEHTSDVALSDFLADFQTVMNDEGQVKRLGWYEPYGGRLRE